MHIKSGITRLGLAGLLALPAAGCAGIDDLWSATTAPAVPAAARDGAVATPAPRRGHTPPAAAASRVPAADPRAPAAGSDPLDAAVAATDAAPADGALAQGDAAAPALPTVTALASRTGIVEAPQANAHWVGYLRAGGRIGIVHGPVGNDGCPARRDTAGAGWYEVEGGGFVCVGPLAALSTQVDGHPLARRLPLGPDLDAALPFPYAKAGRSGAMYRWLPSSEDEREVEPERFAPRPPRPAADLPGVPVAPGAPAVPAVPGGDAGAGADAGGDGGVHIEDLEGTPGSPLLRRMLSGMYVSLDREVRGATGSFWHTQSGGYVREGVVSALHDPPAFQGVTLDAAHHLPVGFAISYPTAGIYQQSGRAMVPAGQPVPRLTAFWLTPDPPVTVGREQYYHTVDGTWVRSRQVRVVTTHEPPIDLAPGEKWVDVNLDHESVVAYEGANPVYATVASTGRRNRDDPDANYETIQGGFRIQAKHVATTMDGNSANDGPYSIEDVPWVMYFEQSFALHGAFWHRWFGLMHSHGCVNLSPPDAHWLFGWTEPHLPPGWHGVYATPAHPGTRVYVHYDGQALGEHGGPTHPPTH